MNPTGPVLADWGELKFLNWVRESVRDPRAESHSHLALSIGDDAAHFRFAGLKDLLVTTDALIEGVHFRRDWISPRDLGAKSLAVNLSDIAAMAAVPLAAFLSLGVPPETPIKTLKSFFIGLRDLGARYQCPLAGGDLVRAPQWTINIMALGQLPKNSQAARRSDARPGQTLYVTGRPGESGAGLEALRRGDRQPRLIARHNRPLPRMAESLAIRKACRDLAMLDVSDGIWNDAGHLARESDVDIEIDIDSLPLSRPLIAYGRKTNIDPTDWALYGGEDYELLFTTRATIEQIRKALSREEIPTEIHAIGRVIKGAGRVRLLNRDGNPLRRTPRTFQHFQ